MRCKFVTSSFSDVLEAAIRVKQVHRY